MKALRLLTPPAAAVDAVAEAEAELARARAELEHAEADAKRLGQNWLMAASQEAAEAIARQRLEFERVAKRAQLLIPQLEARRVAAKAEKQRHQIAFHRAAIKAFIPEFIAALEAAAAAQVRAIQLRQAAITEIGEGPVSALLEPITYRGLLLPDFIREHAQSLRRMFNSPAAAAPRPTAVRPKAAPTPVVSAPAPKPAARPPRRDPPPEHPDQVAVVMLRYGVELGDGSQSVVGDVCTMMADQARQLILNGAAEYAKESADG